jgi:methyltransferase (TIGR00027 family)
MQGASQTALMTAMGRAAHGFTDPDPVFEDPYALRLLGMTEADVVEVFRNSGPEHLWHVARLFVGQRSRFVEERVAQATADGVVQFVDLGAGLSSFAWRRTDLMQSLDLFEVDHPASQADKRERVTAAGLSCPSNMHLVAVDFTSGDSIADALTAAGFNPHKPSIWSWLGVIPYLPVDAIRSTLAAVLALASPGSTLIASFGPTDELMEPASREFAQLMRDLTAQIGEPQITWLPQAELEAIAYEAGWPKVRSVDPASFAPWFANRADGLQPVRYEWLLVVEN